MAVSKEKVDKISDRLYNKPPTTNIRAETPEQRFKAKSMSQKELDGFLKRHFWLEYHQLKQCCDDPSCANPEDCCKKHSKNSRGMAGPVSPPKVCRRLPPQPSPLAKSMTKEEFNDFMRRHFWVEYHKLKECCDNDNCDHPESCCRQQKEGGDPPKAGLPSEPKVCSKPARRTTAIVAADKISRAPVSQSELDRIIQHFYETWTISSRPAEDSRRYVIEDKISKDPVDNQELTTITTRLYSTHTRSSNPEPRLARRVCTNTVGKTPRSEDEMQEIYERLTKTHTKSSAGGVDCKPAEPVKIPGYGQKMYPVIEGIETRFAGQEVPPSKVTEVIDRLMKTQTKASQARLDNPRILLYPERTLLMNEPERIKAYQETGSTAKQNILERREKWFN